MPASPVRLLPLLAASVLAACGSPKGPAVNDAWVRLAAVPGRPAAAYFTVHGGPSDVALVSVATGAAPRTEIHQSRATANGAMTMDAVPSVPVPAGGTVAFAPTGLHAMMFNVTPSTKPGGVVTLTLTFSDGTSLRVPAEVIAAGEAGPPQTR